MWDPANKTRLETWLWLDGPGQSEGRVGGAARDLALEMNAVIIGNAETDAAGAAGVDAWHRLAEITVPVTVACGDLDVLAGMAHQPYLESPGTVAQLIRPAVTGG